MICATREQGPVFQACLSPVYDVDLIDVSGRHRVVSGDHKVVGCFFGVVSEDRDVFLFFHAFCGLRTLFL